MTLCSSLTFTWADHPQASVRTNPFSAASHLVIRQHQHQDRMDGLLAARVVSMICLGLVTWIVGEDIMYMRVCTMCVVVWENQAGSILRNETQNLLTPIVPCPWRVRDQFGPI